MREGGEGKVKGGYETSLEGGGARAYRLGGGVDQTRVIK